MTTKHTTESFISKAKLVHGDKYDYSQTIYNGAHTKLIIVCPSHGQLEQIPNNHLSGKGCPKCAYESQALVRSSQAKSEFKDKANQIHNNRYNYDLVEYENSRTKIKIVCSEHGLFEQTPNHHLRGHGCFKCAHESQALTQASQAKESFKERASQVHNNKYAYDLVEYISSKTKIVIVCPIHGQFEQTPGKHLKGQGCPVCASEASGWTRTKFKDKCEKNNNGLGILYVLECFNDQEKFFKIGITSLSVKERYNTKTKMPYAYSVVKEIVGDPEFIYDLEIKLHREYKQYQYIPLIPFGGSSSECFLADPETLNKLKSYLINKT